jgi:hypothetical protein
LEVKFLITRAAEIQLKSTSQKKNLLAHSMLSQGFGGSVPQNIFLRSPKKSLILVGYLNLNGSEGNKSNT